MKIKKFNENFTENIIDQSYMHLNDGNILKEDDFKNIHRKGKKIYSVNNKYEVVEIKSTRDMRLHKSNYLFPYIVIIKEDNLPILEKLISKNTELKKLLDKETKLRFQQTVGVMIELEKKE